MGVKRGHRRIPHAAFFPFGVAERNNKVLICGEGLPTTIKINGRRSVYGGLKDHIFISQRLVQRLRLMPEMEPVPPPADWVSVPVLIGVVEAVLVVMSLRKVQNQTFKVQVTSETALQSLLVLSGFRRVQALLLDWIVRLGKSSPSVA
jgi:hypothetical protein